MHKILKSIAVLFFIIGTAYGKVVVFWQDGFPTLESQPLTQTTLEKALEGWQPVFANLEELSRQETLRDAELLVLPYGSAVPAEGWAAIRRHLEAGSSLLVLGGRALSIPVHRTSGGFVAGRESEAYARTIGIEHTYEAPLTPNLKFAWKDLTFTGGEVRARRVFVLEGDNHGLAYLLNAAGERVATPVVAAEFLQLEGEAAALRGARVVALDFDPEPGYWSSRAAVEIIRQAAAYARQGATQFHLEMQNATLLEGEIPQLVVRLVNARKQRAGQAQSGTVRLELRSGEQALATQQVDCSGDTVATPVAFQKTLAPGFYEIRGIYEDAGKPWEFYQTGFWVRDERLLHSGSTYGVKGDFLTRDGTPFFPFGTNYFTTEHYGGEFHGAGNAYVWERDFAEMEQHGVTFIRTGVWSDHLEIFDGESGEVKERFLRNLEAFLHSAARHHIHVNFTFYAFDPQTVMRYPDEESLIRGPGTNPYTDPVAIRAQQNYILSLVRRFVNVPHLSWDLINEPSFSSPQNLWRGNTPNGDPTELAAWRNWLKERYGSLDRLAEAWTTTPEELGSFESLPLPGAGDLVFERYGNPRQVRAVDYNLFAQEMFRRWVSIMVKAIRSTGSRQLIDVGQDEGGVSDRVLNQFYADAGVDFTVNHTYWKDDALLWDSVVAKRPGVPNFVGETGYQPVWRPDGGQRFDELTAFGLLERKWALGFAAANSGALQWEWRVGSDFGMKRSDGSNKTWVEMMRQMGDFAKSAAPHATGLQPPEIAIVLPQSLQLSIFNHVAQEAQQRCVRALYQQARAAAYAVGEYQIEALGQPKLILLPSPWTLAEKAWQAILDRVRAGSTLLVTGRFDADEYFHATPRAQELGLDYQPGLLLERENLVEWSGGRVRLSFGNDGTTFLERGFLAPGHTFEEKTVGKGKVLYFALPLELNDNLAAIGQIYRAAIERAGVARAYSTDLDDPGLLICPTQFADSTLYVLTSESSSAGPVRFRDAASGKECSSSLERGRAALVEIGHDGKILASYNWQPVQ